MIFTRWRSIEHPNETTAQPNEEMKSDLADGMVQSTRKPKYSSWLWNGHFHRILIFKASQLHHTEYKPFKAQYFFKFHSFPAKVNTSFHIGFAFQALQIPEIFYGLDGKLVILTGFNRMGNLHQHNCTGLNFNNPSIHPILPDLCWSWKCLRVFLNVKLNGETINKAWFHVVLGSGIKYSVTNAISWTVDEESGLQ